MSYQIEQQDEQVTVYLAGEIDLESSPTARQILLEWVEKSPAVHVNMSSVDYIDSSGVASLVEALQRARGKNVEFHLVEVSEATLKVLALARLDKVFSILA